MDKETAISRYNSGSNATIFNIYKHPSPRKIQAYKSIMNKMENIGGHNLRITGHNCQNFYCGYTYVEKLNTYLVYFTPHHQYQFQL